MKAKHNSDYSIHSDFLIHWTGKDIEQAYKSDTKLVAPAYAKRLEDILEYGLWMTTAKKKLKFDGSIISVPPTPRICFTELRLSQVRQHAHQYGKLGIGVKRYFVFDRCGRPAIYFGSVRLENDPFVEACKNDFQRKELLGFFKPMNSNGKIRNYDLYAESEWRIIASENLLRKAKDRVIVDPRNPKNEKEYSYFSQLLPESQKRLQYLLPLDFWLSMIIYPSLEVKKIAQDMVKATIKEIKQRGADSDEKNNWPIELDLDACRNF